MNKIMKKALSLIICTLVIFMSCQSAFAAVVYPQGITGEQLLESIDKTDSAIESIMKGTEQGSLRGVMENMLYSDETLSSLTAGIYSALEENADTLKGIGIDITPSAVAGCLGAYGEVSQRLLAAGSWGQVDLQGAYWGIENKDDFLTAVSLVLSPFNELLYMLFCGGTYDINALIGLKGDMGYQKAVVPMLTAIGCRNITDNEAFCSKAAQDKTNMVKSLLGDILLLFEEIAEAPCDTLTDILPGIACFLSDGGFDKAVSELIAPLRLQIFNISTFIKVETILSFIQNSEEYTQSFTLNFNDILASTGLKMAEIDLEALSQCGSVSGNTVISNKADTFLLMLRWVIDTLKLNEGSLGEIAGEGTEEMTNMLKTVLSNDTDKLISVLVGLMTARQGVTNSYSWSFGEFSAAEVSFTPNLTREKYQRVVDGIDDLVNEFIAEGGKYTTARQALQGKIYSNSLVTSLVTGIYSAFEGEELKALSFVTDLAVTPAGLSAQLTENSFSSARYTLSRAKTWSSVNTKALNWGFKDGDKEGFIKAVSGCLRPMNEALSMLLCQGSITVLGDIKIYGSDGYNTAVIPLLEALGCSADSILTYEEYKKQDEKGKGIEAILNSLLSLVERFLDRPVYTVTQILPNLLYFIENDGIATCISNLLYPISNIMAQLGLEETSDMSELSDIDIEKLIGQVADTQAMGISLQDFDLEAIGKMGQAVTVQSKRAVNGELQNITYIKADQPAIIVTLMRFIAEMMKNPDSDLLSGFMGSAGGDNDMFATYSSGMGEELEAMTTDETVEWLYKIFFRERAVVEIKPQEEYLPTIIYTPEDSSSSGGLTVVLFVLVLSELIIIKKKDKIRQFRDRRKKQEV